MNVNPVSFGKIFVIRYKKGENTTQEQLDDRMYRDHRILCPECYGKNPKIQNIDCSNELIPDHRFRISKNGIRFFTDNSYNEYSLLKKIDERAAEQFADKEATRLYVEV